MPSLRNSSRALRRAPPGNSGIRQKVAFQIGRGVVVAGRYRVEREIGEGGMGTVWAATELGTKRPVAMKVIRGSSHSQAELRRRFLREARAASAVVHPHVVEVLDVFDLDEETPVLVMELLEGETLASLLEREERLPLAQCAEVLVPAISAVGATHALGIIHRDLKPANIFLARNQSGGTTVKVLDFGIAKLFVREGDAGVTQATRTGSTLGTPSYMAPEQATGQKDVDHLADVWAIGVILYECLSGIRPIEGDTVGQVVMSLMSTGITPIDRLVPGLPEDVTRLVRRMLSRERALRPKDLGEPFTVLSGYTDSTAPGFGAPVSAPRESDESVVRRLHPIDSASRSLVESPRRARSAAIVAGLGVATVVAAVLLGRTRAGSTPPAPEVQGRVSAIDPESAEPKEPVRPIQTASNATDPAPSSLASAIATQPSAAHVKVAQRPSVVRAAAVETVPTPTTSTGSADEHFRAPPEKVVEPSLAASGVPKVEFRGGLGEEVPF
jgi:serine/threonine protein kinase